MRAFFTRSRLALMQGVALAGTLTACTQASPAASDLKEVVGADKPAPAKAEPTDVTFAAVVKDSASMDGCYQQMFSISGIQDSPQPDDSSRILFRGGDRVRQLVAELPCVDDVLAVDKDAPQGEE